MKLSGVCSFLFLSVGFLIVVQFHCTGKEEAKVDPRGNSYVGSEKCRQCHQDIYNTYVVSNHFLASSSGDKKNVLGSFEPGNNTFSFSSVSKIVMEDRDSGLYQVAYERGKQTGAYRFDIAFGKRHAQTFLTWIEDKPYELPISYYTSFNRWATSPGYSPHDIDFTRVINTDCFECHSSFIKTELKGFYDQLDKSSLIYGIDCERCHGPAINHVNYHEINPEVKEPKYIVSARSLTRQQKLDMCALCHSGNDKTKILSRFDFRLGDTLANFFYPRANTNSSTFDVHGNQLELLSSSKCFLGSKTLDCSSCHNPHTNSSADVKEYSQKCVSCHQNTNHISLKLEQPGNILENCIDCHMPKQSSKAITFNLEGSAPKSSYLLRTHRIAIYRNEDEMVKNFLGYFKKSRNM